MSATTDLLASIFGPAVAAFEKLKIKEGLQAIHDKQGVDEFKTTILSAYPAVAILLTKIAAATKTPIDDILVLGIKQAIEESASENGVELPPLAPSA